MAARMKVVQTARQVLVKALQVVGHGHERKIPHFGVGGAGIEGVGTVSHQRPEMIFLHDAQKHRNVGGIHGFDGASPGIASEILKGIGADGQSVSAHLPEAPRHGKMTS